MSRTIVFLLSILVAANLSLAQNPLESMRGVVLDGSNARIVSATVDVTSAASAVKRILTSNRQGKFQFDGLAPGSYVLHVTSKGFSSATATVTIFVGTVRDVTVTLFPSAVQETIGVQGHASSITSQILEMASSVHQGVITQQDLATLPLSTRSFANIAFLAPGTEPVEPSDPTKARITAVSTGGSSGLNNELSVDGADNSDDFIGGFLQNYSPDAIREFNMRTGQEDADTGGTTAGSVIVTTKSGSNQWHGEEAFYERSAALNARYPIENPVPNPKQPFSRQNYVGTLGGPIQKDKLWFFVAFEHVHENASIAYSPASTTQFNALAALAQQGLIPGVTSIPVPSSVAVPFRDYLGLARLDWTQSSKSQWYLRASNDEYTTHNGLVQQGTLPSTGLLAHNNYLSIVLGNQYQLTPHLLGELVLNAGGLHLTQTRNSNVGFALAFPFSSTSLTVSGFETFGDNQFATPITFFPSTRTQEKYQLRYDISASRVNHAIKAGINLIHEPVLGGQFPGNSETLFQFPNDPTYYLTHPSEFSIAMAAGASQRNRGGSFAQNVQRLGIYAQDSWHAFRALTLSYGLRYSTTYGLFTSSGRTQSQNPGYLTLKALNIPLVPGAPTDDRKQFAPRLGFAYSPDRKSTTVLRGGFGLYFADLAQTGWATAFQANSEPGGCVDQIANPGGNENIGCIVGNTSGGTANLIDSRYRTPYAIHISAGIQRSFGQNWSASVDYIHEQGNHGYRAYSYTGGENLFTPQLSSGDPSQADYVPNVNVFHSDNRSSYNALLVHVQGNVSRRFSLVGNYTYSKAQTWGCVLGEIFDYVNGVCDPLKPFAPGDYGPSGEDISYRVVVAGTWHAPVGFEVSELLQAEGARPFTITTADNRGRISINGVPTSLDQFRGTPYSQLDMRVGRPFTMHDRWTILPFAELFNVYNRNNAGANYVGNIGALPVPAAEAASGNVTDICTNPSCTTTSQINSPDQLKMPAGALGDFFGPGTTVGIPFAAQLGVRVSF